MKESQIHLSSTKEVVIISNESIVHNLGGILSTVILVFALQFQQQRR
jgi:hypothetical protein